MKIIRPIESGQCSYYENVKRKRNQKITVAQFINAIRINRWKAKVEEFRRLKAEGLPYKVDKGLEEGHQKEEFVISFLDFLQLPCNF